MKADVTFQHPQIDDRFRRYAQLLVMQHLLLSQSASHDELEKIEQEMTSLWNILDAAQHLSHSGLSSDLNWLRRGGRLAPKARPAQDVPDRDLQELFQARDRGDWHRALHQLRLCSAKLSPFESSLLRASAWHALGLSEVAAMFSRFAAQLEPNNARLAVLRLPMDPQPGAAGRAGAVD